MGQSKLEIRPLDQPFGAEILGVDSSSALEEDEFSAIAQAMLDHVLIVVSDLEENHDWLLDFGRRFGPLVPHALKQYHHPHSSDLSIIAANLANAESRQTAKPGRLVLALGPVLHGCAVRCDFPLLDRHSQPRRRYLDGQHVPCL